MALRAVRAENLAARGDIGGSRMRIPDLGILAVRSDAVRSSKEQ